MKNYGQEEVQAEFGVDKLLKMSENKNGRTQGLFEK
jgi:hypothetical protein